MSKRRTVVALLALVIGINSALADIAPTEFVGSGIVPVGVSEIRMTRAKVDIVWGTPCDLSATFDLDNESPMDAEVQLGFPMVSPQMYDEGAVILAEVFTIAFNGIAEPADRITRTRTSREERRYREADIWYHCRHVFPPGRTVVTVTAKLPASLAYHWPGREELFYQIETGGKWKGTIGYEEVNIHFPGPVAREQIFEGTPAGYQIEGNTISWRFQDIEPKGKEYDIHLTYLRPDVFAFLSELRKAHQAQPANADAVVRLAKHLFLLGNSRGAEGYTPKRLEKNEYDAVLAKIKSPSDRALFTEWYVQQGEAYGHERDDDTKEQWLAMVSILSAADFQVGHWRSAHVDEARGLLERLIEAQPNNAEAWNVYLANFDRFGFGCVGFGGLRFSRDTFFPWQIARIRKARENCPEDVAIRLWSERCDRKDSATPVQDGLWELLRKNGVFDNEFPRSEYGYY